MAQRLFSLSKWTLLEEGKAIHYINPRGRPVAIEVNSPDEVAFYVIQNLEDVAENPALLADKAAGRVAADEDRLGVLRSSLFENAEVPTSAKDDGKAVTFLALVKGRDRLEFSVDGAFDLMVEGGNANVYTVDSADVATRIVAPIIFTRVANRRVRNPELEWMMYQQRRNQEDMLAAMSAEMERRLSDLEKGLKKQYAPNRETRLPPERAIKAGLVKAEPVERSDGRSPEEGKDTKAEGADKPRTKVRAPALDHREGED